MNKTLGCFALWLMGVVTLAVVVFNILFILTPPFSDSTSNYLAIFVLVFIIDPAVVRYGYRGAKKLIKLVLLAGRK